MAKKWMSKYSQQLFLLAVLFIIFAVLAGKSEYFLTWKNMRNILEAASYRMVLAVGMTFVISSGVMDLSAGSIVSLCGVLTALALHGGMGIWRLSSRVLRQGPDGSFKRCSHSLYGNQLFRAHPRLQRYASRNS